MIEGLKTFIKYHKVSLRYQKYLRLSLPAIGIGYSLSTLRRRYSYNIAIYAFAFS
jgi:hypothetical protein